MNQSIGRVRGGPVGSVLDQSRGRMFKSLEGRNLYRYICSTREINNYAIDDADTCMMSTPTAHRRWEKTTREITSHPPSYAEAKKMKSLTFHTLWLAGSKNNR